MADCTHKKPILENAWVAVQTRVLHEKKAAEHLYLNGYECFLPLRNSKPFENITDIESNRPVSLIPLFPGYLFCRYRSQQIFRIKEASGVIRILGGSNNPEVIPDDEIDSIQKIVNCGFSRESCKFLKVGWKVRVKSGCFDGVEGYLVSVNKNTCKIASGISILGKAIMLTMVNADIQIIDQLQ